MKNQQEAWGGGGTWVFVVLVSLLHLNILNILSKKNQMCRSVLPRAPQPQHALGQVPGHCNTGAHCSKSVPLDHSQPSPHSNLAMLLRQEGNSNFPGPRWIPVLLLFVIKPWKPSSKSQHTCRQSPSKHTVQGSEAPRAHQKHLEGRKRTAPSSHKFGTPHTAFEKSDFS